MYKKTSWTYSKKPTNFLLLLDPDPLTLTCMPPPPAVVFCNQYLKILDFSQLFITNAPMKKTSKNLVLSPRRTLLGYPMDYGSGKSPMEERVNIYCTAFASALYSTYSCLTLVLIGEGGWWLILSRFFKNRIY